MSGKDLTNVGASVRQRLLNRAIERGESHQDLLTRYAIERFLYRLVTPLFGDEAPGWWPPAGPWETGNG